MIVLGSGLSGCLASLMIPGSVIKEPLRETKHHNALLRFRSPQIGEYLGIPFKKVVVHKSIYHNGKHVNLSTKHIIRYSRKVSNQINARSICNIAPVERWIAPIDFHEQMLKMCDIEYNVPICQKYEKPTISTLPIFLFVKDLNIDNNISKIYVSKFNIENCDIHLTNYITDTKTAVYRASISGNELIMESTFKITREDVEYIKQSFGLDGIKLKIIVENFEQSNGKIAPLDEIARQYYVYELTKNRNIYSLGRFATWRNIVLDDVFYDIKKIKGWINQTDYEKMI